MICKIVWQFFLKHCFLPWNAASAALDFAGGSAIMMLQVCSFQMLLQMIFDINWLDCVLFNIVSWPKIVDDNYSCWKINKSEQMVRSFIIKRTERKEELICQSKESPFSSFSSSLHSGCGSGTKTRQLWSKLLQQENTWMIMLWDCQDPVQKTFLILFK